MHKHSDLSRPAAIAAIAAATVIQLIYGLPVYADSFVMVLCSVAFTDEQAGLEPMHRFPWNGGNGELRAEKLGNLFAGI